MPPFTPQLDSRQRSEFLDHCLRLLPITAQVDWARLLTQSWAFRLEPPRDVDLPTLPEKTYPMIDHARAERLQKAVQPPSPLESGIRKAERDQAISALINGQPVSVHADIGADERTFLAQIVADARVRTRFRRIWWFNQADSKETVDSIGAAIAVALELPHLLKASPGDRPTAAREYLEAANILLVIASVPDEATIANLREYGAGVLIATHVEMSAETTGTHAQSDSAYTVRIGALNPLEAAHIAGFANPPSSAELALIDRVGGSAQALAVIRGLITHDSLTINDVNGLIGDRPLDDLLAASYAALPADYQAIGAWFQDSQPVALADFMARFPSLPIAKRTLRFLADRGFLVVEGDTLRAIGWPPDRLPGTEPPLSPLTLPIGDLTEPPIASLAADHPRRIAHTLYTDGIAAIEARKDDDAEALLTEALMLRQRHDHAHAIAETYVALGRLAYLRGDDAQAIHQLEAAAALIHALRDGESLDVVRVALSRVYRHGSKLDSALSLLGDDAPAADLFTLYALREEWPEALAAAERNPNHRERRWQSAYAHLGADQIAEALQAVADHDDYECWLIRALVAHRQDDLPHALTAYERADAAAGSGTDRGILARGWACALASAGHYADAAVQVSAAGVWYEARLGRPIFARQQISHALHAAFSLAVQDFETANKAAHRALDCPGERIDAQARAMAWHVLARIADHEGNTRAALTAYQAALKEHESITRRDEGAIGLTLRAIAECYTTLGEIDRAIANDRRALTHLDEAHEASARLNTLLSLRAALESANRTADALTIGSQLIACAAQIETSQPLNDLHALGYALTSQADALITAGRPSQADQTLGVWLTRLAEQLDLTIMGDDPALQVLGSALLVRSVLSGAPGTISFTPSFLSDLAEEALRIAEAHWLGTPIAWAARRDLGELHLRNGEAGEALAALLPIDRGAVAEVAPLSALRMAIAIGRAALLDGQFTLSIDALTEAAALEPDQVARGGLLRELAGAYEAAGDLPGAADNYRAALALFEVGTSRAEHVSTLIDLGYARLGLSQFAEAIETFESALTIVESFSDAALMSRVLIDLANAHYTLGQYRRAAAVYRRALDYQTSGDLALARAGTLVALAGTYAALNDHTQALSAYHDALHATPSPEIRQQAQIGVAMAYVALGQPRPAIDAYNAALRLETLTSADRGTIERGLGQQYTALGEHEAARKHFEKALHGMQDADGQSGLTLRAIADGYLAQGQLPEAITIYRQALDKLDRAHFPHERASVYRALGDLSMRVGTFDEALPAYENALEIERALPKKDGGRIVATLRGLAAAHEKRNDFDKAILAHHQALVYQDARHAPEQYVQTLIALGRLYSHIHRYGEAAKALEDALVSEYNQPHPDQQAIAGIITDLADVYRAQGSVLRAAELYRQAAAPIAAINGSAADPVRSHATEALGEVEAEITRYRQMLQAVDQSWAVLSRDRKPDVKSLALLRALQAQIHAALGEMEVSTQRIDQLAQLLDSRRAELNTAGQNTPELHALALWLNGYDAVRHGERESAADEYGEALVLAESKRLAPELIWVIRVGRDTLG